MGKDNKTKKNSSANSRKGFAKNSPQGAFSLWTKEQSKSGSMAEKLGQYFAVGKLLFCLAFSFVFSVLVTFEIDLNSTAKLGELASKTIRAPFDFQVVDQEATVRRQKEEIDLVPIVLDYYPNAYEAKIEKIRSIFSSYRLKALASKQSESDFLKKYKEEFDKELGITIKDRTFKWLYSKKFNVKIERALLDRVESWAADYLVEESQLKEGLAKGYALVRVIDPDGGHKGADQKLDLSLINKITSYENIEKSLPTGSGLSKYDIKKVSEVLRLLKEPNLIFNRNLFSQRKAEVKEKAIPVVVPVEKNQVIVQQGSIIQSQDILLINEIKKRKSSLKKKSKALLITVLLSVLLISGVSLLRRKFKFSIAAAKQDFLVLFSISFFGIIVTKLFIFLFEGALFQKFGSQLPSDAIILMSPFAMLFMLASLLVRSRPLIWLFIIYFAVGMSFLGSDKFSFLLITIIGGMAAVRSFSYCRSRNDFYRAGLVTGLIIALASLFVYALEIKNYGQMSFSVMGILFMSSILGGLLSAIFTVTFVPLFEAVFDIMTDLKLLELSSLSHPLLKELMVRAPGTYHHCMVVGSMVEAACNEIGVNGLLAKVMAYFHDVGKMEHASYFIENQRKGHNPHDEISPYLSKTIIIAHVKDGVELISKHRLGRDIMAGVKEHHGTTLISYFHRRAMELSENPKEVKEADFRYPGPKPQFKESAILMLADSIEAAARTIEEPSPLKIQNLIDNMVDAKFRDGQLDLCNITFSELTKIKEAFYKILVGVYHHRVEYPGSDLNKNSAKKLKKEEKVEKLKTPAVEVAESKSAEPRTLSLTKTKKSESDKNNRD